MEFVPRKKIGPYEIAAHLDSGGMADVYLALGKNQKNYLVIKVLREHLKGEQEVVRMFLAEGRIMSSLTHPNVVRVEDFGNEKGCPYIAMEYLVGEDLAVLARMVKRNRRPLAPSVVAEIGRQAASGLAYVHQARNRQGRPLQLVHRDISPQNIFLCSDGRVKILDFGIALSADRDVVTRTGLLKGKLTYMSPEQIRQQDLDGRSDLFALGVVLWEALAEQRLFKAENDYDSMQLIMERDAPHLGTLRPDVPKALADAISRCLARKVEDRFSDAGDLDTALAGFLRGHPMPDDGLKGVVSKLLGRRLLDKQRVLDSLKRQDALLLSLFSDLDESISSSGSQEIALEEESTDREIPAPATELVDLAPLEPPSQKPAPVSPKPKPKAKPSKPKGVKSRKIWVILFLLLALGLAIGGSWWLVQSGIITVGEPVPLKPTAVLSSQKASRGKSQISLECNPAVKVFVNGKAKGLTPIKRLRLKPGSYDLTLVEPASQQTKFMSIQVERGKHSRYQIVF